MLERFSKNACALAILSALASSYAVAADQVKTTENEEEILFTANRTPTLASEVGSQSIVITEQEIQNRQYHTVVDALSHQPGLILSQNSSVGPSSIFIRGSDRTLLLIDGVPAFDLMGTSSAFNYNYLGALLSVDRIEVLKGPQSSLYGSSAMGGVVQVFTNNLNKPGTKIRLMAGSHETVQVSATTTGQVGDFRYSLGGLFDNTKGIDATTTVPKPSNNYDKDRIKNRQLSGKFNYILTEELDVDFAFTYNNNYSEYDNTFNTTDYNDYNKSKLFTGRLALNGSFLEDQWTSTLAYSLMKLDRDNYSGQDVNRYDPNPSWKPGDPDWMATIPVKIGEELALSKFKGKTNTVNFDNQFSFYEDFKTLWGLSYQDMKGKVGNGDEKSQNTKSVYVEQSLDFADSFYNTVGIRYDKNSEFGSKTTYRLTSRYNVNDMLAFKGSYGSGFLTPTLYQIFGDGQYVKYNPNLKAETSRGYDLGVEIRPTDNSIIGISYFHTNYKNMIAYGSNQYENLDRAKIKGYEITGLIELNEQLALSGSYTYLNAKQKSEGGKYERMARRPKHQVTTNVTYKPISNLTLNASAVYYGKRIDTMANKKELDSFTVLDIAASYKINNTFEVDAKVQNVFNKDYEYAAGYRERGRTAYVGLNISL